MLYFQDSLTGSLAGLAAVPAYLSHIIPRTFNISYSGVTALGSALLPSSPTHSYTLSTTYSRSRRVMIQLPRVQAKLLQTDYDHVFIYQDP